jgi:hypothetical protein
MDEFNISERMFYELRGSIRSLQEEIMRLSSELRDHLEIQRHPMYERHINTTSYAGVPWNEPESELRSREDVRRIQELLRINSPNLSPVQVVPEETVTGWDPAENA